jgi:type II secretion system protein I
MERKMNAPDKNNLSPVGLLCRFAPHHDITTYNKHRNGFTVLEILVALMIISIVVISVIQLFSINLRNLTKSSDQIDALILANSKMREILELEKIEEKAWNETDGQGNRYEISVSEILNKRTENLLVKLEEITLTLYYRNERKEKTLTLKTAKVFPRLEPLKTVANLFPREMKLN